MNTLCLQSLTRQPLDTILPDLVELVSSHGGWLLERSPASPTAVDFDLELPLRSIFDIYSALLSSGLELTRDAHLTLSSVCASLWHTQWTLELERTVSFRFEIRYVPPLTPTFVTSCQPRYLA